MPWWRSSVKGLARRGPPRLAAESSAIVPWASGECGSADPQHLRRKVSGIGLDGLTECFGHGDRRALRIRRVGADESAPFVESDRAGINVRVDA